MSAPSCFKMKGRDRDLCLGVHLRLLGNCQVFFYFHFRAEHRVWTRLGPAHFIGVGSGPRNPHYLVMWWVCGLAKSWLHYNLEIFSRSQEGKLLEPLKTQWLFALHESMWVARSWRCSRGEK